MVQQYLLASDFDQTLSFNDSGVVLAELIGVQGFHDKVRGLAQINLVQQEEAFLAALLMDIGMLVLDTVLGEQYGEICSKAKTHGELAAAEKEALGMTHAQVQETWGTTFGRCRGCARETWY